MLDAELTIVGPDGPIRGGPGARSATGAIPVIEVRHTLVSPRDVQTGQATGKRRHEPITVVKEVDRSSPVLIHAWVRNDVLPTWKLDVLATDQFGRRRPAYTIELRGAAVSQVALTTPEAPGLPHEAVSFVYQAITWTFHDGRTSATDDWMTPV